jgi:two-component system, NarL family, response regulator LiaR
MSPIRIIVADDERLFRECLVVLLGAAPDIEVVGQAADGVEAVERVRTLQPDVVVLDLMMPRLGGQAALEVIKQEYPQARILILTSSSDDSHLFMALDAGAQGYMLKEATPDELLTAIRNLHHGQAYLHPSIAFKVLRRLNRSPEIAFSADELTKREREVLALVAQGFSNREIGDKLVITRNTASKHVSSILGALHLTRRVQAALYVAHKRQVQ